jgi:hypothetical protein
VFREYFIKAEDILRKQGLNPLLRRGEPLSEADIDAVNQRTDHPMPAELRRFYIEMGDGFKFAPNDISESPLDGWERNWLSDYAIWNKGFHTAIEEEVTREIASSRPRVDPQLLREEAERRKKWIPFYGFVGAGNVLCLDSEGKVQSYQAMDWTASPDLCRGFVLADSFTDFVARWSKYSFVAPGCGWTSFCWNRSGVFDWSPAHFPHGFDRSSLQRL